MRTKIISILQRASKSLKKRYPINSIAVFGSTVRDDFHDSSDIDIIVDFQSSDFILFNSLAEELEILLKNKIDLVTLRSLKPRHLEYLKDKMIYV